MAGLNFGSHKTPTPPTESNESTTTPPPASAPVEDTSTGERIDEATQPGQVLAVQEVKASAAQVNASAEANRDPSADDVGMDVERAQDEDVVGEGLATQAAADAGAVEQVDDDEIWSSHPMQNFSVGPFHFANSVLRLKSSQFDEFHNLLETMPANDRINIKKISLDRAKDIVNARLPTATKQFDSSVGRAALQQLKSDTPTVGTVPVGFSNQPQRDNNQPVPVQPIVDPEGETGLDQGPHVPEQL